jgi:hypothetical protein
MHLAVDGNKTTDQKELRSGGIVLESKRGRKKGTKAPKCLRKRTKRISCTALTIKKYAKGSKGLKKKKEKRRTKKRKTIRCTPKTIAKYAEGSEGLARRKKKPKRKRVY